MDPGKSRKPGTFRLYDAVTLSTTCPENPGKALVEWIWHSLPGGLVLVMRMLESDH